MKKILAMLLVICLCVLSLAGCVLPAEPTYPTESVAPSGQTEQTEPSEPVEQQPSFEGLTVVDNDECVIKITELNPNNLFGYSLKVELENKSSDVTYMFSVTDAAVNGVQTDPLFAAEVAAGKKPIENITILDSTLKENGITVFTDIELSFRVYDSSNWLAEPVAETTVHVYPYGEDKATVFVRESKDSDQIIVDNENVTVTVIGYEESSIWGYIVHVFLQNKSDKEIMFTVDDASVNGYMADPFWSSSVSAGKCAFASIIWLSSTLEECGIFSVEEIKFLLRAYDYGNWISDDLAHEQVTLNP